MLARSSWGGRRVGRANYNTCEQNAEWKYGKVRGAQISSVKEHTGSESIAVEERECTTGRRLNGIAVKRNLGCEIKNRIRAFLSANPVFVLRNTDFVNLFIAALPHTIYYSQSSGL